MNKLLRGALVALLLAAATLDVGAAAGSVVVTERDVSAGQNSGTNFRYREYSVAWTSDASGDVSFDATNNAFAIRSGYLESIRFIPGTTTPSNLYDVTLIDRRSSISSADLLAGTAIDRSSTVASVLTFDPRIFMDGARTLSIVVANAGNAKTGTVVILVRTQ